MKVYHTFDFESANKRIEPNIVDKYQVQAEDYENINDLIKRSIRTRTKFHEDVVYESNYDIKYDDDDILKNEEAEVEETEQSEVEKTTADEVEEKAS